MTPSRTIRSSRACTVPRATPSRREHSSTPTRGSAVKTSTMRWSSESMVILHTSSSYWVPTLDNLSDDDGQTLRRMSVTSCIGA